jgi:hypothetical protein
MKRMVVNASDMISLKTQPPEEAKALAGLPAPWQPWQRQ